MTEPQDALLAPQPHAVIPDLVNQVMLNTGDLFSPSSWILKAIELIPQAKDAIDGVRHFLAGDWNSVLLVADALAKLADFNETLADETHLANTTCSSGWDGNAADAAYSYFESLREALDSHVTALSSTGHDLQTVAFGMQSQAELIEDILTMLLDWVIIIAASAAASALASPTGVGAISWVSVAIEAYLAGNTASQLVNALGAIAIIVDAVDGLAMTYLGAFNADVNVSLPGAYDNKLVN